MGEFGQRTGGLGVRGDNAESIRQGLCCIRGTLNTSWAIGTWEGSKEPLKVFKKSSANRVSSGMLLLPVVAGGMAQGRILYLSSGD